MSTDTLVQIAAIVVGLLVHGSAIVWKLGQLAERLTQTEKRCDQRSGQHSHHFEKLDNHSTRLADHSARLRHLEGSKG